MNEDDNDMTPEERRRQMDFILNQQTQFAANQQIAEARLDRLERVIKLVVRAGLRERKDTREKINALIASSMRAAVSRARMEETQARSAEAQTRTVEAQRLMAEAQRRMAEAQMRTEEALAQMEEAQKHSDAKLEVLIEAQSHSDARLDALIDIVRNERDGKS